MEVSNRSKANDAESECQADVGCVTITVNPFLRIRVQDVVRLDHDVGWRSVEIFGMCWRSIDDSRMSLEAHGEIGRRTDEPVAHDTIASSELANQLAFDFHRNGGQIGRSPPRLMRCGGPPSECIVHRLHAYPQRLHGHIDELARLHVRKPSSSIGLRVDAHAAHFGQADDATAEARPLLQSTSRIHCACLHSIRHQSMHNSHAMARMIRIVREVCSMHLIVRCSSQSHECAVGGHRLGGVTNQRSNRHAQALMILHTLSLKGEGSLAQARGVCLACRSSVAIRQAQRRQTGGLRTGNRTGGNQSKLLIAAARGEGLKHTTTSNEEQRGK